MGQPFIYQSDYALTDLPEVSPDDKMDVYQRFELSLPFSRTLVNVFMQKLEIAEKESGSKGFVTIEELSSSFETPAWEGLRDYESDVSKLLRSNMFKNERKEHTATQIDTEYLRIFALLHCPGRKSDKAIYLHALLQEGDHTQYKHISANDKDFKPVFEKMCSIASWELFSTVAQIKDIDQIYSEDDKIKLQEQVETLREDIFLEQIFGNESRLETDEFIKAISCHKWCFKAAQFRSKLFAMAEIGVEEWVVVEEEEESEEPTHELEFNPKENSSFSQ